MSKRDYYEVLGVHKNAQDAEIKKAYRKMAKEHHPDRNAGNAEAEAKFKEINEAYEVLSDSQKRAVYDQYGHAGLNGAGAGGPGGFSTGDFGGFADAFGDIFGDIFGGGGGGRGGQRQSHNAGSDLRYDLEVALEEIAEGKTIEIEIPAIVACDVCDGSGAKPGTSPITCTTCHGRGQVRMQQGFFTVSRPCPQCEGTGTIIPEPCSTCHGQGRLRRPKKLKITVPKGADEGTRIRLSGHGEPGLHGAPSGDLYIVLHLKEHPIFDREGPHLLCEVPISFTEAALGAEAEIPTLGGRAKIKIPAGTQNGRMFRLRGKGIFDRRSGATGDLLVRVKIEVPVNLSEQQKDLLRQFAAVSGQEHHPQSSGFWDSVKNWFDKI
ncbi:MAG: molecular chaperone DnaJ [Alphaproteobacteria bacterium CG_4_10_14_0_2_um_filter_63_37]|nr:MAG: molecular chaperone DnaJ [Proteobacteria bacterium CG1_02_64_396]PJA23618.1 MAG: molecular chaperone DnaJ [Alphaproteobacteria bacterium CG_4_10_14_0_2_um_filter_63_37]